MRKLFFIIPIVAMWSLMGCEKEEVKDLNQDLNVLQDSISVIIKQHNALIDSVSALISAIEDDEFDIKAYKMQLISTLFESIARQPEASELLISATEMLYYDYAELLPISDEAINERGMARGYAFSSLFSSIARQPEAFGKLDSAATKFLGAYNSNDISDELLEITRIFAMTQINEAIARQPEADSLFNLTSLKYLNFELSPDLDE